MEFRPRRQVARPPGEVFAFFRDIDQLPWHTHPVVAAYRKITPGPAGVGTRYRETVRLFAGRTLDIVSEITAVHPDDRLEYRWAGPAMHGELTYEFRVALGGTEVLQWQTLEPHGALRLLTPLIRRAFAGRIADRLEHIAAILEGRATFAG